MNAWVFVAEAVILCLLFTFGVMVQSKKPLEAVFNLPQPIINRCIELGLVDQTKKANSPETRKKKLLAAIVIAFILALVVRYANGARSFWTAFIVSYGLWLIIDWYDCFVIDWGWVCHSRKIIIPGTEDLIDSYKDYKFHFIGSLKGMLYGLPICIVVSGLVQLMNWIGL